MTKCLKCGYERQPRDFMYVPATECPSCGVVYIKAGAGLPANPPATPVSWTGRASALDESSLKQARQRVEMRLRQRGQARLRDERYALTLERARQIAAAAVKKRQAQMLERRQAEGLADPGGKDGARTLDSAAGCPAEASPPEAGKAADPGRADECKPAARAEAAAPETSPQTTQAMAPAALASQPPPQAVSVGDVTIPQAIAANGFQSAADQARGGYAHRRSALRARGVAAAAQGGDSDLRPRLARSSGMRQLLPLVAWLILLAGVIGMILSWTTLGSVQAGVHSSLPNGFEVLPLGLLLGFAYLATGVLGFAFFWVSSLISRQLKDIRRILLLQVPVNGQGTQDRRRSRPVEGKRRAA